MKLALACVAAALVIVGFVPPASATDDCTAGETGVGDSGTYMVCVLEDHTEPSPDGSFAWNWPLLLNWSQEATAGDAHVSAGGESGAAQYITNACGTSCYLVDSEGVYSNGGATVASAAGAHSVTYGAGVSQTYRQQVGSTSQRTGAGGGVTLDGQGTGVGYRQDATPTTCSDRVTVTVLGSATQVTQPCALVLPDLPGFPDLDGPGQ
jgi:hypothetical protein